MRSWICAAPAPAGFWTSGWAVTVCCWSRRRLHRGEEAVLLIGAGGSGKSTLSVQAASMGFGFLGDDYTLLEPGVPRWRMLFTVPQN